MQLTEQQAKLLLTFYSSDGMTLKYAEYARENGIKKYEVSRIGESLSEMGLINRDDPRKLILTDEGESAAKDIKTRIEIAKAHLSYVNVNSADIDGIAFTWVLHCPYSWEKILKMLVKKSWKDAGKNEEPSYALIDSQSVKTTSASENRGYDGGKNKKTKAAHRNGYNGKPSLCSCSYRQYS